MTKPIVVLLSVLLCGCTPDIIPDVVLPDGQKEVHVPIKLEVEVNRTDTNTTIEKTVKTPQTCSCGHCPLNDIGSPQQEIKQPIVTDNRPVVYQINAPFKCNGCDYMHNAYATSGQDWPVRIVEVSDGPVPVTAYPTFYWQDPDTGQYRYWATASPDELLSCYRRYERERQSR